MLARTSPTIETALVGAKTIECISARQASGSLGKRRLDLEGAEQPGKYLFN